jgi:murein DD-endopeptidase MepM/ murein hydrolase activator NlpD
MLKSNGDLVADGVGWLKDQNGNYINKDGSRTRNLDPNNAIGAADMETGLAKILGLNPADTTGVRNLMTAAGMQHVETGGKWVWQGNAPSSLIGVAGASTSLDDANIGKTIFSSIVLDGYGDSVAAPVLMNGLDNLTDFALFGGSGADLVAMQGVSNKARGRYDEFLAAKGQFYFGEHKLLNSNASLRDSFGYDKGYPDEVHKGIDVVGSKGTPIFSLFGGKVIRNDPWNPEDKYSSGNTVAIELGFGFENYFYDTGVQEQFMHLDSRSPLSKESIVSGSEYVGAMGNTGFVKSDGGDGTHLHYQLMGDRAARFPDSERWDMYEQRRDAFLSFVGSPSSKNWTVDAADAGNQNFWSSYSTHLDFYYNTNAILKKLHLDASR